MKIVYLLSCCMPKSFWTRTTKRRKNISWQIVVLLICLLIFLVVGRKIWGPRDLHFPPETRVVVLKGDSISKFYWELSSAEVFRFKRYLRNHPESFVSILDGSYVLSGKYTAQEFLDHLAKGPEQEYAVIRILEGRSIYDIDESLTSKWLISKWEYIAYTTNSEKISALSERYEFFDANLKSLEGFLYPDTYHIDTNADIIRDLVSIQLNTFKKKVREGYSSDFSTIQQKYGLDVYKTIVLASIVEKEEKNSENKPTVAGIFYNRLQRWMKIEADITLCYNFKKPYADCSPSVIVKNISDEKNPYNTRRVWWLPPTPIANPDIDTIKATLFPKNTSYLFYLHDPKGGIHYAETNEWHNKNKVQWL